MKTALFLLLLCCLSLQVQAQHPTTFSDTALANPCYSLEEEPEQIFGDLLEKYRGKTIVVELWASWCGDCLKGIPKLKALQESADEETVFLMLSIDKEADKWRKAVAKHDIPGRHYRLEGAWEGDLCNFMKLDWIPRYFVVNPKGEIALFRAITADAVPLLEVLDLDGLEK